MRTPTPAKRRFWLAPSGRLHWLRGCSGGAGAHRMKAVNLTREQAMSHGDRCRCVRWTER